MKKSVFLSAFVVAAALGASVFAQDSTNNPPQPARPYGGVGVIDLKYIFDNFTRFKQMKAALDQKVKVAETDVKARQEQVRNLVKILKDGGLREGSSEFLAQEDEIRRKSADLKVLVEKQKASFVREESQIYFQAYEEIRREATAYCGQYGFGLVLRFNGEPLETAWDPRAVMRQLNKPVVIVHPNNDVTPHVLKRLNDRYKNSARRPGVPFN